MKTKLGRYIVPSVLATVGTSCYTLADTFFISPNYEPPSVDRAIQSDFSTALEMTGGPNGLPSAAA